MNKWIYICHCINWCWQEINQWLFEIVSITKDSYKLKQIEKWFFDYLRWYTEKDWVRYISGKFDNKHKNCIKYIEDDSFVIYLNREWLPFIFNIIKYEKLTY